MMERIKNLRVSEEPRYVLENTVRTFECRLLVGN